MMVFQAPRGRSGRVGRHEIPKPKVHLPAVEMAKPTGVDVYAGNAALTSFSDVGARRLITTTRDAIQQQKA